MKLAYLCIQEGDDNAAAEGFIHAAALAVTIGSSNIVAFFNYAEVLSHLLDRPRLGLSQPLREVADMAMRFAKSTSSDEHLSEAGLLAALYDREVQRPESCLANVLASIWYGQRHQASESPSVLMRSSTKHRLDERRAFAADTALQLGQTELLAELIEGARLQALAETEQQARRSASDDLLGLLGATETSLRDVHPVSINGQSRVAEASGGYTGPVALPLEPAITAVGGPDAVYWGSWAAFGKCYWAVRTADGTWIAGALDHRPNIEALLKTEHELRSTDSARLGMFDNYDEELSLAQELGHAVLPPPLVDLLRASTKPVSLVVAGSFVCDLPLPALVLPGTSDDRLVERAVIYVQPPLVLMKAAAGAQPIPANDANRLIVRLACLDARGDLPHARNYDILCELLLTSPSKDERAKAAPPWSQPANRANLAAGLQRLRPGESALFVYSGHVQQNGVADGPETSLVLADGFVSAAELAAMPIPSHVILSACSSSGASGTGAGEWLGLAGSLLVGGAREIVATSWPIPDSEFTADFECNLVARICASGDAASALRQSQLDALASWRHRRWRASEVLRAPLPRTWAAFQMVGATREYHEGRRQR